ncbi:lipid droplet-associated perilipin protein, partial [Pluteus cervinus]
MSSTATTTDAQPDRAAPEITILQRVASIPLVSSSLVTIDGALTNNAYTCGTYGVAKGLSSSAYKFTEPLQARLAPLIVRADGLANKAVDVVEQRYPYPFTASPEDVANYVRGTRDSASASVNKTIDERLKNPAYSVVQGIDQRFAPIVDYIEVAVHRRINSEAGPSNANTDSKFQYQRALALSKDLKDHLYGYSNEQLRQIHAHSVILQRATETASSITNLAASSLTSAQTTIHGLSDNMLTELQKLQASTSAFASTASNTLQNNIDSLQHNIPPQLQQTYSDLSSNLGQVIVDLKGTVLEKDLPIQDKVTRVAKQVRESISPLLETLKKGAEGLLASAKNTANGVENGSHHGHDKTYAEAAKEATSQKSQGNGSSH